MLYHFLCIFPHGLKKFKQHIAILLIFFPSGFLEENLINLKNLIKNIYIFEVIQEHFEDNTRDFKETTLSEGELEIGLA
jgi:hypothetical protein